MSTPGGPPPEDSPGNRKDLELRERLREATRTLEHVVADRGLLALLPAEERTRLRQAAASVFNPDTQARRLLVKAVVRQRKSARTQREDGVLSETGIDRRRIRLQGTRPHLQPGGHELSCASRVQDAPRPRAGMLPPDVGFAHSRA